MKKLIGLIIILMLGCTQAQAFSITGGNPTGINRFYLMPALDQARALDQGKFQSALSLSYSNEFANMASKNHRLLLDMECLQGTLALKAGFIWRSEVSLEADFTSYNAGVLDPTLESYHDALGVGNSDRRTRPGNEFAYQVISHGKAWFSEPQQASGLGDIRLGLKKAVYESEQLDASLKATVKIPTGDPDKVLGSGGWDTQFMAMADWKPHIKVVVSLAGGYTFLSRPDFLEDVQISFDDTWFGAVGLAYHLTEKFSLFVQSMIWATPYGETGISVLDNDYGEVTFGGKYKWDSGWGVYLALSEDLSRAAADFTAHSGLEVDF